ncbi:MAG: hypothetical protein ABSC91_07435 [Candidatus Bathyarchaeia archaeon]
MVARENALKQKSAEDALMNLELLHKEFDEEETKLRNKKNPTWDELRQALKFLRQKSSSGINEIINLSWFPEKEKVMLRFYRDLLQSFVNITETLFALSEVTEKLKEGLLQVAGEVAKSRGTSKDVEDLKAKLDTINKDTLMDEIIKNLEFYKKLPVSQVLIQQIQGGVQGNVYQEIEPHLNFNQQVAGAFKHAYLQVENKADVSIELKQDIRRNLEALEKELKSEEPDAGKVQSHWRWVRQNANWVVPTIMQVVIEGIKIALRS